MSKHEHDKNDKRDNHDAQGDRGDRHDAAAADHAAKPDAHATSHTDDALQSDAPTNELAAQVAELTEALQRERADATNLRRRHDEDMAALRGRTKAQVVRDLLPVIDNFERALKHVPSDLADNDYVKGVQGVVKQFEKTLQDMGVERIKTTGEPFDPRFHEAVSMEEGEGGEEVVSEELQSGYKLGEDVIRHAMVKVRG